MGEGTPEWRLEPATPSPLQPHPLADVGTMSCRLAKARLLGEGQGEGRLLCSDRRRVQGYAAGNSSLMRSICGEMGEAPSRMAV